VVGLDDEASVDLLRLFNEPAGIDYLIDQGVKPDVVEQFALLGISGIANLLSAIKLAKHQELDGRDVVLTVATDSLEMYESRLAEMTLERGEHTQLDAAGAFHRYLMGAGTDHVHELGYWDRMRIHNLKYYTWVEQQGKTAEALNEQWYDRDHWTRVQELADPIDELIDTFNREVAAL